MFISIKLQPKTLKNGFACHAAAILMIAVGLVEISRIGTSKKIKEKPQRMALKMLKSMSKKRAPQKHIEASHQRAFVRWFRANHPNYADFLTIASWGENIGGKRMNELKALGLTPGYPDLKLAIVTAHHAGLYIEMKKPGGRVSMVQRKIHELLRKQNYKVETCYNWEQAKDCLTVYLGNGYHKV